MSASATELPESFRTPKDLDTAKGDNPNDLSARSCPTVVPNSDEDVPQSNSTADPVPTITITTPIAEQGVYGGKKADSPSPLAVSSQKAPPSTTSLPASATDQKVGVSSDNMKTGINVSSELEGSGFSLQSDDFVMPEEADLSSSSIATPLAQQGSGTKVAIPSPLAVTSQKAPPYTATSPLVLTNQKADVDALGMLNDTPHDDDRIISGIDSSQSGGLEASSMSLQSEDFGMPSIEVVAHDETDHDDGIVFPSGLVSSTINLLNTPFTERKNAKFQSKSTVDFAKGSGSASNRLAADNQGLVSKSEIDLTQSSKQTVAEMKKKRTAIQITTFTNWLNDRLKLGKNERRVEDLFLDLKDGMLLIKLLENLTKKKVKGFTGKVPKTEAHKIVNLDLAFKFMESEKIKLVGVGGMNIYQGNTTLTLGMIWTLIQKYQMRIQGYRVSTKQVMISWIQSLLPRWNITNLTSDWRDGRALIALINTVKPGIAPNVASLDPTKRRQNCTLATNVANSYLKIPKIISPDDLSSGNIDERSVMTYLAYFVEPFRAKLLKWVQKMLPQYGITGFAGDWYNGRAFGALLTACVPGVAFTLSQQDSPEDYAHELLRVIRKKMGVTPPFESTDLIQGRVEELQIMTMVMLIRHGELIPLADEVAVYGKGIKGANFRKETSFTIDTSEAGPGQLFIDAYYEDDGEKLTFSLTEKTKRLFDLKYTPLLASNVVFDISWSDDPITDSPFTVPVTDTALVKIVDSDSVNTLVEVGKPLSLIFDAKKAGQGNLSGYLQHGKEKIPVRVTVLPSLGIRFDYTPTKPGVHILHVFWNKEELEHLAVTYTVVDIGGYSVHSLPKNRVYCTFEEPEFCIVSEKGLPLSVLQMTAVLSLDVQIDIKFTSVEDNVGYASFTPTLPGEYRVEVVCVDQLIKGCPFSVKVTDPHNCKVINKIPSFLEVTKPHTFEIDAKDAGVGQITFDSSDHDISSLFEFKLMRPDSTDVQKLEVTPLVEGDYIVGIKYQNQWISNSPFRVQICDPSKFELVERLSAGNVGQPFEFTVRGKEKCEGSLKPIFKATGPSAKYSPIIQLSEDGLCYSVKFVPWEIGEHEISITYGGFDIPRTPVRIPVSTFDSNACSAAGSGLQKAFTNVPAQFVILSNKQGLIEDGTLNISIRGVIDGNECRIRARDNKDGSYAIAYLVQKPGAYLISVQTAGQHIPGSPFKLNALLGPEADKCHMFGPALSEDTVLMFGKPIDFTVDTVGAGAGKLVVKATGPDGAPARVFMAKSDQPGKYDISIDALSHGKHRVNVKWSGQHIPGSPFTLKIFPGADARKCLAYGPGLEDGKVGKKSSFTIETKNAGAGVLRVRLHGLKGAFKIQLAPVDQKNRRTLLANYNPQLPGEYLITIKWSETNVPGSPFRVKIFDDGTMSWKAPLVYTPTPRPQDMLGFTEDEEADDEDDDRIIAVANPNVGPGANPNAMVLSNSRRPSAQMQVQPPPTFRREIRQQAQSPQGQQMPSFVKLKQQKRRSGGSKPRGGGKGRGKVQKRGAPSRQGQQQRRNQFDGQVSVQVQNPGGRKMKRK